MSPIYDRIDPDCLYSNTSMASIPNTLKRLVGVGDIGVAPKLAEFEFMNI